MFLFFSIFLSFSFFIKNLESHLNGGPYHASFFFFVSFYVNRSLTGARQRWKAWFTIRWRIQSKSSCCLCQQYRQSNRNLVEWLVRLLRLLISLWWNKIYNSFFFIFIRRMRVCRMGRLWDSYMMIYTCGSPIFFRFGNFTSSDARLSEAPWQISVQQAQ